MDDVVVFFQNYDSFLTGSTITAVALFVLCTEQINQVSIVI